MARDSDMLVRRKEGESASLLRKEGDSRVSLRKPAPSAGGVKSGSASLSRERATDAPEAPAARAMRPRERAALKNALKRAGAAYGTAASAVAEVEGAAYEEDGRTLRYASWFAKRRARKGGAKSVRLNRAEAFSGISREELARRAHGRDVRSRAWKGAGHVAGAASGAMAVAGGGADSEDDVKDLSSRGLQAGVRSASRVRDARLRKSAYRRATSRRRLALAAQRRLRETKAAQAATGALSRAAGAFKAVGAAMSAPMAAAAPIVAVPAVIVLSLVLAITVGAAMDDGDYDLSKLTPNERAVASYLLGKGVPLKQTAAIMGNMFAESGMNPSAVNAESGATGLCQWLGGRKDGLTSYAAATGRNSLAVAPQLDYLWAEATGEEPTGVEMSYASTQWGYWNSDSQAFRNEHGYGATNSWEEFLEVKDVKTACRYWYAAFERGRPYEERVEDRCGKAQEYYVKMHKKGSKNDGAMGQAAVDEAYGLLGAPYVFGASGPDSFDCSGLVIWCYSAQGYDFGSARNTDSLWAMCAEISEDDLEPGDLVFMNHYSNGHEWGHVGMYFGDGKVIHTATVGTGVTVEPLHGSWLDDNGLAFGRLP